MSKELTFLLRKSLHVGNVFIEINLVSKIVTDCRLQRLNFSLRCRRKMLIHVSCVSQKSKKKDFNKEIKVFGKGPTPLSMYENNFDLKKRETSTGKCRLHLQRKQLK